MTFFYFIDGWRRIGLRIIFSAITFLLFFSASASKVWVSGNISGNTLWQADTIMVTGNVTVTAGVTLDISPGVLVQFQGYYGITVLGILKAAGMPGDTICFTVADTSGYQDPYTNAGGWCGIYVTGSGGISDTTVFSYCKFMYCKNNIIYSYPCKNIRIDNSRFRHNQYGLRFVGSGTPVIKKNVFHDLGSSAISYCDYCSPEITYNVITHAGAGVLGINGSGVISHNIITNSSLYCAIVIDGGSGYSISKNYISDNPVGGISIYQCDSSLVEDNIIEYNGRGLYIESPNSLVIRNIIAYNTSAGGGSGIFVSGHNVQVVHNRICNNRATGYGCGYSHGGGGIMCVNTSVNIINNVICNNESESIGAGICILDSVAGLVVNNTIARNLANQDDGGGVYINSVWPVSFNSNILWGNRAINGDQLRCFGPAGAIDLNYCLIEDTSDASPGFTAAYMGLLLIQPEFSSPTLFAGSNHDGLLADWSLLPFSPCINSGRPDTAGLHLHQTDISGNNRINGRRIDIGAYENNQLLVGCAESVNANETGLHLFPNPAGDIVKITCNDLPNVPLRLNIADAAGRVIYTEEVNPAGGELFKTIDLAGIPGGIYSVWLENGGERFSSQRLIRE